MSSVDLRRAKQKAQRVRWQTLIEDAVRSGRGPTEFCRSRGLDVSHYYYWRRVLARKDQEELAPGRFALVDQDVTLHDTGEAPALELVTADGWRLQIRPGVDKETLRLVIDALRPNP